MNEKIFRKQI
uniref:Uncharacterized protein n=1 Tax=Moniliophthora roreri TaxID=221103 RepID=A0A0W0G1W5_MONRR